MLILSVERRRKHLCLVKTDSGEYSIDIETAAQCGLREGMSITEDELLKIQYSSEFTRAKNRALWLLSMRDYSQKELYRKLKPEYDEYAMNDALDALCEVGVIDDERFARTYAAELSEIRRMSRKNIRMELIKKGIDRETAAMIIEELPDDEVPAIMDLIRVKYPNCFDDEKVKNRMYAGLARKGYSFDDIRRAINEYNENERNSD